MSDLIERLRELASCKATFGGDAEAYDIAADEIERLTAALSEARAEALESADVVIEMKDGAIPDRQEIAAAIRQLKERAP